MIYLTVRGQIKFNIANENSSENATLGCFPFKER